jgi:hypothetical protein
MCIALIGDDAVLSVCLGQKTVLRGAGVDLGGTHIRILARFVFSYMDS